MSKKVSYMNLLKEAISEFDTSDSLEVKGPMLDPIISWDGGGEIPTYKDAASILERYYFNEDKDEGVTVVDEAELEAAYQNDKGSAAGPSMKNAEGAGTEQAGTSDADTILGAKKEKAEDIAKEDLDFDLDEESLTEEEWLDEDELAEQEVPEIEEELATESEELEMENAIIEKLIEEMESEDELDEAEVMTYTGDGPEKGVVAPKEKEAESPEEDAEGAGTEQAGTGPDEGQIPPRKDLHDKMVKPKVYEGEILEDALTDIELDVLEEIDDLLEQEVDVKGADEEGTPEQQANAAEEAGEEASELDVDKEVKEALELDEANSAVPGGPSPNKLGEDWDEDEKYYGEAMELFREEIEEDVEDIDSDDLRV